MILTDREIQACAGAGQLVIKPKPDVTRYSSTSLDLTLSRDIRVWSFDQVSTTRGEIVTPGRGFQYAQFRDKYTRKRRLSGAEGYVLAPREFLLAWTRESVTLPNESRIAARVEGKSSLARLGLGVHVTAPIIHAGFQGPIQLEVSNCGPVSIRLMPDMPICQLVFELTLGTPQKGYMGQFHKQTR